MNIAPQEPVGEAPAIDARHARRLLKIAGTNGRAEPRAAHATLAQDSAPPGFRSLMVHVHEDPGLGARLQATLDIGHRFDAHVSAVQVTAITDYLPYGGLEGIQVYYAATDAITIAEQRLRKTVEARLAGEHLGWSYTQLDADPAGALIDQSKLADLNILSLPGWASGRMRALELLGNVAMASRVPTLAVPDDLSRFEVGGCAAIAWNGSFEAARAVKCALPLLRLAATVTILTVEDENDVFPTSKALTAYLGRHGVTAVDQHLHADGHLPARVLRTWLDEHNCDYLVMALYGHSRLRELLFSGTSRTILLESRVPIFVAH